MNINSITPLTEYAGFWRRSFALLADTVWIGGLMVGLLYLFEISEKFAVLFTPEDVSLDWTAILMNDIFPAAIVIILWYRYATTPGKWLIDCEIVDATTGMSPTFAQAITRYLAYIIALLPFGLGFLWILWDKRRQGWHDKLAHTVVIVHDEATVSLEKLLQDSL